MFGRLRAPVVITTTEHANADELQVSTTVEAKTGDASASGCRSVTTLPIISSSVAKPQSAPVKSWIDRTSTQPTAAGLRWALGRGRTVTVGRPSVVWLCGLDGRSQARAGWALEDRALKKTLEALYTAKVNNRDRTPVVELPRFAFRFRFLCYLFVAKVVY